MDQIASFFTTSLELNDTARAILFVGILYFGYVSIWPEMRRFWDDVKEESSLQIDFDDLQKLVRLGTTSAPKQDISVIRARYEAWVQQEDWAAIQEQINRDDKVRNTDYKSEMRSARVGVRAAMADIHEALGYGGEMAEARALDAVERFDQRHQAEKSDMAAAVLAAEAHMEIGWMYRGGGTIDTVSRDGLNNMQKHFDRAGEILAGFDIAQLGSATLAASNFRYAVGICGGASLFHAAHRIWLEADAADPEMMGQVAFHLLPRWYGSYRMLHRAAADIADRTADDLGDQAYAMTLLSVAVEEPELVAAIDAERLAKGAFQMLEARSSDQSSVNYVVAGLFYLMQEAVGKRRAVLRVALRHLFETKMKAFLLDYWPDGVEDIREDLAKLFGQELSAGSVLVIDENGFRLEQSVV